MQILKTHYHPDIKTLENKTIFTRLATRSITLQGNSILLMYTERYEDYSLPGGGLDLNEDKIEGMIRELCEETGANNIKNIQPFGAYEEYRPWYKPDFDIHEAINHNKQTMASSEKKGMSIERETYLLELIAGKLIK